MSNLIKLGNMVLNTDFIQNIFEDPDNPGTWLVVTNNPLAQGKKIAGPTAIPCLVFSGAEGAALKWYVDNFVYNITAAHTEFLLNDAKPKRPAFAAQAVRREAQASVKLDGQTQWDRGGEKKAKHIFDEVVALVKAEEDRVATEEDSE